MANTCSTAFGDVGVSLLVAGAVFGDIGVLLLVAGPIFGDVPVSLFVAVEKYANDHFQPIYLSNQMNKINNINNRLYLVHTCFSLFGKVKHNQLIMNLFQNLYMDYKQILS